MWTLTPGANEGAAYVICFGTVTDGVEVGVIDGENAVYSWDGAYIKCEDIEATDRDTHDGLRGGIEGERLG